MVAGAIQTRKQQEKQEMVRWNPTTAVPNAIGSSSHKNENARSDHEWEGDNGGGAATPCEFIHSDRGGEGDDEGEGNDEERVGSPNEK